MIVADTSLIVHLFNRTELTGSAQKIVKTEPHWVMPPIWQEEYANVLSKLARKDGWQANVILKHFDSVLEELKHCVVAVDIKRALEVSLRYKISVYNAHFVFLAISLNTIMVTEDREVIKKCPDWVISMSHFLKQSR